jgi:hypothetical protein
VLLGEASVEYLGILFGDVPTRKRSGPVTELSGFDVLISDGTTDIHRLMGHASVASVPLVLWKEGDPRSDGPASIPVLHGANVATALTAALLEHPDAAAAGDDAVRISWTEPGKPLKRGVPVIFPEPIGNVWARKRGKDRFVAFVDEEWGGAVVDVEGPSGRRIVGVSDHAAFTEAIVLAAVGLVAGEGNPEPTVCSAATKAEQVLNKIGALELDIAVWRSKDSQ